MPLSARRKRRCLEIIDELLSYKISRIFADPVDPLLDHAENYFDVIKYPMDLGTVRSKLVGDAYDTFSEFHRDVSQIWENAKIYNGEYSLINLLAKQLKSWFDDRTFLMSDDEEADWVTRFHDLQNTMWNLSTRYTNAPEQKMSVKESSALKKATNTGEYLQQTINNPNSAEDTADFPTGQNPNNNAVYKRAPPKKPEKRVSQAELIELHQQITHLDDEDSLLKVLNIIRTYEHKTDLTENSAINLNDLSMKTRVKLFEWLQKNG